jgi:hypothetical protein
VAKILILSTCDVTELDHGGKIDLFGILNFLKELKHETLLIAIDRRNQDTSDGITSKRISYLRYIFSFSKYPYMAYSRKINEKQLQAIHEFAPEILILMTEFMLPAYLQIRHIEFKKIILRRANNEYLYLRSLLSIRNPILSIYRIIELLKMSFLQDNMMKENIDLTLDIAKTEYPAPAKIIVSGPINSKNRKPKLNFIESIYDFGYIGNLSLTNARDGVNWFLDSIVPRIRQIHPEIRILIAGRSPSNSLKRKCKKKGIILIANPYQVANIYSQIKIFVNPVFKGSGINMKLITPIENRIPIVTTSFGSRGFPEIDEVYGTADSIEDFSQNCLKVFNNFDEYSTRASQILVAYKKRESSMYELIKSELDKDSLKK